MRSIKYIDWVLWAKIANTVFYAMNKEEWKEYLHRRSECELPK